MIGEVPWSAAIAVVVVATLAGGWTVAWLIFHKRGGDGSSMKERYDRAEAHVREAESRYEEVRSRADESEKLARQCDDLRQEREDIRREHASLGDARAELDRFATEEETKLRNLAREGEAIRGKREEAESRTDELARKEAALGEEINRKQAELDGLQQSLQTGEETRKKLDEEIESRRAKKEQMDRDLTLAEETLQRRREVAKEARAFGEEINRKQVELDILQQSLQTGEETRKKLDEELESHRAKREQMDRDLTLADGTLRRWREAAEEAKRQADKAERKKEILEHDIERFEKKRLESERGRLGNLGNLDTPPACVSVPRGPRRPNDDESEALREVLEDIRSRGLEVEQRMLWRLHTSLKVAEVSPLTVLAGISGTGKTQLPRAYAEAMGMYLLVVPVQPRWDSPRDLVGSYDYMHKRYQATELAQLLWSFDPAQHPDRDRDDRMAMVLLDEMNLARPEYYFSDFLSRLELRRTGGEYHDPSEEARIELDIPHGEGEPPKRLYPSERILWVGTMNEDESTQTLSDKVIDRSNVMRFPRPRDIQFNAGAKVGTGRGEGESRKKLTAGQWRQWCLGRKMPEEAGKTIKKINEEVMEAVGRPFGHRMGQAMARYVERYPTGDWRKALSDQIGMRVLTKLTGLDRANNRAESALDTLGTICKEGLRDEHLADAVGEATSKMHDAGTFEWNGYLIE